MKIEALMDTVGRLLLEADAVEIVGEREDMALAEDVVSLTIVPEGPEGVVVLVRRNDGSLDVVQGSTNDSSVVSVVIFDRSTAEALGLGIPRRVGT